MRVVTGQLAPNDFCVERTEGSLAVVRRGVSGRYRTASAVPLQPEQPFGDGRYAVPHPKLDDRVRLSRQFPQLVAVFVDVGLRAAGLLKQLLKSQIGQRFHSGLATAAGSCLWRVAHRICCQRIKRLIGRSLQTETVRLCSV
jgi:hypothetical protein